MSVQRRLIHALAFLVIAVVCSAAAPVSAAGPAAQSVLDDLFMAQEWQSRNNLAEARKSVQDALAAVPLDPFARIRLAELDALDKNYPAAASALRNVLADDPGNVLAFVWLGHVLLAQGDTKAAQAGYAQAIRIDQHCAWAHFGMASCLLAGGRTKEAAVSLRLAQADSGDDAALHLGLARTFLALSLPVNARVEVERALELEPRNTLALELAGRVYQQIGLDSLALSAWRQALALAPQQATSRFALVETLSRQARKAETTGNRTDSERLWRSVLEYDPQNQQAREGLGAKKTGG